MRCYRRLLNSSYKDHVTNEEVHRKIQAAIGEYEELLTLVKKRKLRCFGHVSRSSGLAKTILQGTVKGKRKRGRQKKRWEDNIKEWTGMDFASSTRAAENRLRWKGIVANYKIGSGRISKMAAITKNSKNNKINFFSRTAGYFWLNFGMEYQWNIGIQNYKNEKICSVVLSQRPTFCLQVFRCYI